MAEIDPRKYDLFQRHPTAYRVFLDPAGKLVDSAAFARLVDQTRDLEISAVFGQPGAYRSVFFPTAAGPYTFRITGTLDGEPIDESFTSGPDTFSEVRDVTAGQFPVAFPATADIVRDAEAGAAAATTATIALVLGGAGLVAGLVALGLSIARRRA